MLHKYTNYDHNILGRNKKENGYTNLIEIWILFKPRDASLYRVSKVYNQDKLMKELYYVLYNDL